MTWQEILSIISAIVSIASSVPYAVAIIRRKARPQRITWLIIALLNITFLISTIMTGGNVIYIIGNFIGAFLVFLLSIKFGIGGKSRFDIVSFVIALVALGLLIAVDNKLAGLLLAVAVNVIALGLTVKKTIAKRDSEPRLVWILIATSSFLGLISLTHWSLENVLVPVCILSFSSILSWISTGKIK